MRGGADDAVGVSACAEELRILARRLEERLSRANFSGYTLTLKIKFADFLQMTRARTRDRVWTDAEDIFRGAEKLLEEHLPPGRPVRLLGITISHAAPVAREEGAARVCGGDGQLYFDGF